LSFTSTNTKLHVQVHALQAGRLALCPGGYPSRQQYLDS
jgi:hypothetical protein